MFDDFIACAEHLIKENYTSAKRLVINGGSNGGLLTSATMLQRPELFGAVITEVAVTDMFRFHLGTYGSSWKSDYGDPGIKADFNTAAKYSPLHNVKPGAKYPPHLIKTGDRDDRVLPWHSFKLAATLQLFFGEFYFNVDFFALPQNPDGNNFIGTVFFVQTTMLFRFDLIALLRMDQ